MILPRSQGVQSWEVHISHIPGFADPADIFDIDTHMFRANFCYNSASYAVLGYSEYANEAIEEPNSAGSEQPVIVEVETPFQDNVIPASDNDQYGENDMKEKEGFVRKSAEVQVT